MPQQHVDLTHKGKNTEQFSAILAMVAVLATSVTPWYPP